MSVQAKSARIEIRCAQEEKARWTRQAGSRTSTRPPSLDPLTATGREPMLSFGVLVALEGAWRLPPRRWAANGAVAAGPFLTASRSASNGRGGLAGLCSDETTSVSVPVQCPASWDGHSTS